MRRGILKNKGSRGGIGFGKQDVKTSLNRKVSKKA